MLDLPSHGTYKKKYLISVYRKAVSGEYNDNHTMFMDPPKKCVILFFYIDIKVFLYNIHEISYLFPGVSLNNALL